MTVGDLLSFYRKNITGTISIYCNNECILKQQRIGTLHSGWLDFDVCTFEFYKDILEVNIYAKNSLVGTNSKM